MLACPAIFRLDVSSRTTSLIAHPARPFSPPLHPRPSGLTMHGTRHPTAHRDSSEIRSVNSLMPLCAITSSESRNKVQWPSTKRASPIGDQWVRHQRKPTITIQVCIRYKLLVLRNLADLDWRRHRVIEWLVIGFVGLRPHCTLTL